jgi:hypothetical protein
MGNYSALNDYLQPKFSSIIKDKEDLPEGVGGRHSWLVAPNTSSVSST